MDLREEKEAVFVRGGPQVNEHIGKLNTLVFCTELVLVGVTVNFIDPEQRSRLLYSLMTCVISARKHHMAF